jgi:hypothetical protein
MVLFTDLDGTLLSYHGDNSFLTTKNRLAINKFQSEGGLCSVATGRNLLNAKKPLSNMDISLPMVLVNGALIVDELTEAILYKSVLNQDFLDEAIQFVKNNSDIILILSDIYQLYFVTSGEMSKLPSLDFKAERLAYNELPTKEFLKATFLVQKADFNQYLQKVNEFNNIDKVNIIPSSSQFIEVVNKEVSKGNAILKILTWKNLLGKTLTCIGDYLNDEEMLQIADYAFVPENGHPSLKKEGRFITSNSDLDAVVDMFRILDEVTNNDSENR